MAASAATIAATIAAIGLVGAGAQQAAGAGDGSARSLDADRTINASPGEAKAAKSARNKTYGVSGDQLTGGKVKPKHLRIWSRFIALIPTGERTQLGRFTVLRGNNGAFVVPLRDPTRWRLGVSAGLRSGELDYVLVHEFGHLLTLEADQVPPGGSKRNCSTYFTGEGCSLPDSYVASTWRSFGRTTACWTSGSRRASAATEASTSSTDRTATRS